jgi:imidazolonepropionase-like amidohydrolase
MGGVTSVREVGGLGLDLSRGISDGTLSGPHVYAAGSTLSQTGGHGDLHGIPLEWMEAAARAGERFGHLCDGVAECLKAVRVQLRRGAQVIKVHASGGVMSQLDDPVHQQFTADELRAIVEEAQRADRAVAAHCHGKPGIMAALQAGVTSIEHGTYLDQEAAEMMIANEAILVPTRFVVAQLLGMLDSLPPYAGRKIAAIGDRHREALGIAITEGVTIAMGTDIFVSGDSYGHNSREIRHLIEAGMTPLQAIEAATANGPLTLGALAPMSGQLREGYDADIIAFDANPLEDLSIWGEPDRVTHVWKSGESVKNPA